MSNNDFGIDKDRHGNPICGQDFMGGTICTLPPKHGLFHGSVCQECGQDWLMNKCICLEEDDDE